MSKFRVGDTVDTTHWGIVTVKSLAYDEGLEGFRADYQTSDGIRQGLFFDTQSTLVEPKPEPVVVPSVDLHNAAQLDRIERLLRFQVNRFYGVVMDDDGTFRKTGILPEYSNQ